jgi:hypothetical protein
MNSLWNKIFGSRNAKKEKKQECCRFMQFVLLPKLADAIRGGKLDEEELPDLNLYRLTAQEMYGDEFNFNWSKFKCRDYPLGETHVAYLYEFPKPKQVADVRYSAVVVNVKTGNAAYYTLERALGGSYVVCQATVNDHYNLGTLDRLKLPLVLRFVCWLFKQSKSL